MKPERIVEYLTHRRYWWSALSLLGERVGLEALVYNPGVFQAFHLDAQRNAPLLVDAVQTEFPAAHTVLDIGCGTGTYAAEFLRRGIFTVGVEYTPRAREWAARQGVPVAAFDLAQSVEPPRGLRFDVAVSLEVAEHVPAALANAFVQYCASASDRLVVTAAHPGQGGQGHINEQPQAYWIERFDRQGFDHDSEASRRIAGRLEAGGASSYLVANMMVFRRRGGA